jgi:hypothetical protein
MHVDLGAELVSQIQGDRVAIENTKAPQDAATADLHTARSELESTRRQLQGGSSLAEHYKDGGGGTRAGDKGSQVPEQGADNRTKASAPKGERDGQHRDEPTAEQSS